MSGETQAVTSLREIFYHNPAAGYSRDEASSFRHIPMLSSHRALYLFPFPNRILGWSMSGLILFIVAVALLGVAIYSLVSYLKERRASQLPVHKKKK